LEVYVGEFSEEKIKKGIDKIMVEKAKEKNNLNYVNTKIVKKNNKMVSLKIWVCDMNSFKI